MSFENLLGPLAALWRDEQTFEELLTERRRLIDYFARINAPWLNDPGLTDEGYEAPSIREQRLMYSTVKELRESYLEERARVWQKLTPRKGDPA
jgi:hypothetical protein